MAGRGFSPLPRGGAWGLRGAGKRAKKAEFWQKVGAVAPLFPPAVPTFSSHSSFFKYLKRKKRPLLGGKRGGNPLNDRRRWAKSTKNPVFSARFWLLSGCVLFLTIAKTKKKRQNTKKPSKNLLKQILKKRASIFMVNLPSDLWFSFFQPQDIEKVTSL